MAIQSKAPLSRFYFPTAFLENKTSPLNQTAISAAGCGIFFFFSLLLKGRKWKMCEHLLSWNDAGAWTWTTGTFQTELSFRVGFITANLCPQASLCPKDVEVNECIFPFQSLSSVLQRLYSLVLLKHQLTTVYTIFHPWRWIYYFFNSYCIWKCSWAPFRLNCFKLKINVPCVMCSVALQY